MAEDHLVHFVIQALQRLPLSSFAVNPKGCADEQYPRSHNCENKNVTYQRAQPLRTQLQQEVRALSEQAERADQQQEDPQALCRCCGKLARRQKLLPKMHEACARLEARAGERAAAQRADSERPVAGRPAREGSAQGPAPKPPPAKLQPDQQIHRTDPVLVAMPEKLWTAAGRALDRLRSCGVEPVFGVIQAVLGFRPATAGCGGWRKSAGNGGWCA